MSNIKYLIYLKINFNYIKGIIKYLIFIFYTLKFY